MNTKELTGNWRSTVEKPEDESIILVACEIVGGYRIEAAYYDKENDSISLFSGYGGGEDFDIWQCWKYADENTMVGRSREMRRAIENFKASLAAEPPFKEFLKMNEALSKMVSASGATVEQMKVTGEALGKLGKAVGPYSQEEIMLRKGKKYWWHWGVLAILVILGLLALVTILL